MTIAQGEWITDLAAMTCWNIDSNILVGFERTGNVLLGKIKNLPVELLEQWADEPHGERNMEKAVMEAEDVFLRAYFEIDIARNGISNAYAPETNA